MLARMAGAVFPVRTEDLSDERVAEIRAMLLAAFDGAFAEEDWEHCLGGWHFVAEESGEVVSHAAVVIRELHVDDRAFRAGYIEGVATDPARQRQGLGSLAMAAATDLVRRELELGALSTDAYRFYQSLGWERWHGPTFVRDGDKLIRTEEEDDGIMVLRTGPSAGIDLSASISCETRPGDDW